MRRALFAAVVLLTPSARAFAQAPPDAAPKPDAKAAPAKGDAPKPAPAKPDTKPAPAPAKPDAPKPAPPKPVPAKADAPKPDAPKPAPAKADAPKTDAPKPAPAPAKTDAPKPAPAPAKADAPKPDAPKPDAPKADAPKPDAPKADAPKADADAPKTDAPKPDADADRDDEHRPRSDADEPREGGEGDDDDEYEGPSSDMEPEDEGQGEDAEDHRHHGHIHHEPGLGLEWVATHARLRLGIAVQPLARYGHDSVPSPDVVDTTIRRARVAFDAELTHGTGLRVELQVKNNGPGGSSPNNGLGIADLYGRWALDERLEVQAGFLGAPGGLERDMNPLDLPFVERSALSAMTRDRELGVKLVGHQAGQFWAASVTRDAPPGIGGDDPDITPSYPPGVAHDSTLHAASQWNEAARVGTAPSDEFAASVHETLRFRESTPDYGEAAYEPNGTVYLDGRPYRGTSFRVGGDAVVTSRNLRVLGELGFRRDGQGLSFDGVTGRETKLDGNPWWVGGYLVVGWTPRGGYGRAADGAPLQWGFEILARLTAMKVKPVDAFSATLIDAQLGIDWAATPHFRLQADVQFQSFGAFDQTLMMDNAGANRWWGELAAIWRL